MRHLFYLMDADGDGTLDWEEQLGEELFFFVHRENEALRFLMCFFSHPPLKTFFGVMFPLKRGGLRMSWEFLFGDA